MQRKYYALHKPYGYLSQFTDEGRWKGLKQLIDVDSDVYSVGRLDAESEGLLLLTNDSSINQRLLHPKHKHSRTYCVQVEGSISGEAIRKLCRSVEIKVGKSMYATLPANASRIHEPEYLETRMPPVRERKTVPTSWVRLTLTEGKNRQVRKMTAAVGFPTLRLIRESIESIRLEGIKQGELQEFNDLEFKQLLKL
ncbi:MAG: pseudouridine synthase [Flavobacteriales bacterium]